MRRQLQLLDDNTESAHEKQLLPIQCSGQLLTTLIEDIGKALSATKAVPPVANHQQEITTEFSRINFKLLEIDDLKKKSEQLQENYYSDFRQLATLSVSIIAIIVAILAFIGTNLGNYLGDVLNRLELKSVRQAGDKPN